jgi:hypothetical protein
LGALPTLQHLHLRLLPLFREFGGRGVGDWAWDSLPSLFGALRRLTGLTSLVLEGPQLQCYRQQQGDVVDTTTTYEDAVGDAQQQLQLQGPSWMPLAADMSVYLPEPWVAELCAALPPSLCRFKWATHHNFVARNMVPGSRQLHLPLQLGHLTALTHLALSINTGHSSRVLLAASVLQPLRALKDLRLTPLPPVHAAPQQARCLVHLEPMYYEMY